MAERQIVFRTPADIQRALEMLRSKRCQEEVTNILKHPVDGVRFMTVTTRQSGTGQEAPVLEFDLKKYDAYLTILLPKKYPFVAPVVSFDPYKSIPKHPDVDEETGRVRGHWTEEGKWKRETSIRDLCASVMTMLAEANTPEVQPSEKQSKVDDSQMRFATTWTEFKHLCNDGAKYMQELRSRYGCIIKLQYKKNRPNETPHLLIVSALRATREAVAVALDKYLVQARVRHSPKFKGVDPEPDAEAFVSFYKRPSVDAPSSEQLINFMDEENGSLPSGDLCNPKTDGSGHEHDVVNSMELGNGDGYGEIGLEQNKNGRNPTTIDDPTWVQEYSKEELLESMEIMKTRLDETAMNEWVAMQSMIGAVYDLSSKVQKNTGDNLVGVHELLDNMRNTITVQRRQYDEQGHSLRELNGSLFRFRCQVCLLRAVDTRLDCGHGLCRTCARGNECFRCRKKIQSSMTLFY